MKPLSRRTVLGSSAAALALVATLSACGTTEDPASDSTGGSGEKITLTDARGKEITLDGPAKRVGTTEWNATEYALSLGVAPVAASDVKGYATWDGAEKLPSGTTDLGTRGEPSTDSVASAGLDVLFVTDSLAGKAVQQIEDQGTPVVLLDGGDSKDPVAAMWKNVDIVARATGTEDEAARLKRDFEDKVAQTAKVVADSGAADAPVAFADGYSDAGQVTIRPYGEGSLLGGVMKEVGLTSAWSSVPGLEFDPAYGLGQTDVEGLTKLPDDTRFWYIENEDDASSSPFSGSLAGNQVWRSLPFVKAGAVQRIPDRIWMFGGPAAMEQFLDAVQQSVRA
ncbi:ABC transporter substrate-binding protein [Marmoricola endophyticus]|uniref:ABC transporter substrate-binding protein n=1 Tax=Marmoricola endophyticus TaxID=2040280 RepID=A0A917BSJ4_9ACTN|nr:ABC transporter substrate-binding protein [Marmoricola endophyticus]GGF57356.1 ABC transporter substrate-binding protein [Marmoricola endophyticus]